MNSQNFPLRGTLNDLGWMTLQYTTTIPYFHASRDGINSRLISCLLYQTKYVVDCEDNCRLWLWLDPRDLWTVHSNPSVPGTLSKSSPLDKISPNLFRVGSWWIGSSEMSRSSRIRNFIVCTIVRETFRSIELPFRVAKWSFLKEKSFKKDVWKCDLDVTYYFFVRCHLN